ncbi:MAG: sigma-70 family RNA polymerase sigma factor [Actinomycetes bacterium]
MTAGWDGFRLAAADSAPPTTSAVATAIARRKAASVRMAPQPVMHPDLEPIFREQYLYVVAVARRVLRSESDAEDVAQEVFVSFARSSVPGGDARAWLTVAATHAALNVLRSQRRRLAREVAVAEPHKGRDPETEAISLAEQQRVRDALVHLPRRQAVVLVLRHSGLSYADIAEATQLSPSSVGTTLRRAEAALRKELSHDSSL